MNVPHVRSIESFIGFAQELDTPKGTLDRGLPASFIEHMMGELVYSEGGGFLVDDGTLAELGFATDAFQDAIRKRQWRQLKDALWDICASHCVCRTRNQQNNAPEKLCHSEPLQIDATQSSAVAAPELGGLWIKKDREDVYGGDLAPALWDAYAAEVHDEPPDGFRFAVAYAARVTFVRDDSPLRHKNAYVRAAHFVCLALRALRKHDVRKISVPEFAVLVTLASHILLAEGCSLLEETPDAWQREVCEALHMLGQVVLDAEQANDLQLRALLVKRFATSWVCCAAPLRSDRRCHSPSPSIGLFAS